MTDLSNAADFAAASPETALLESAARRTRLWLALPASERRGPFPIKIPLGKEKESGSLLLETADEAGRAVLAPADPVAIMLAHREEIELLRAAVGSAALFDEHVLPALAGWAAMVQRLPRSAGGLWSGRDGFFSAGASFARSAVAAVDARVLEPSMAPIDRAQWTERIRVAAAIAGLLADVPLLCEAQLRAGTVCPETGRFHAIETFSPCEETALEFAVRHAGRALELSRREAGEGLAGLPAAALDVLRLTVPEATLRWLGSAQRRSGETVLSALKCALAYRAGETDAERVIARAAALGVRRAADRRARLAALREGRSPVLEGLSSQIEYEISCRLFEGEWLPWKVGSPLVRAEDGWALRWPEGYALLAGSDSAECAELPDDALEVLGALAAGNLLRLHADGDPVWRAISKRGRPKDEETFVRFRNRTQFDGAMRRGAAMRGEPVPPAVPRLFDKTLRRRQKVSGGRLSQGLYGWLPGFEADTPEKSALAGAVQGLSRSLSAGEFALPQGLFVPEALLPEGFLVSAAPALADILVARRLGASPLVHLPRLTYLRRAALTGRSPQPVPWASAEEGGRRIYEGVLVRAPCVRPIERWDGGSSAEAPWPTDYALELIDEEDAE